VALAADMSNVKILGVMSMLIPMSIWIPDNWLVQLPISFTTYLTSMSIILTLVNDYWLFILESIVLKNHSMSIVSFTSMSIIRESPIQCQYSKKSMSPSLLLTSVLQYTILELKFWELLLKETFIILRYELNQRLVNPLFFTYTQIGVIVYLSCTSLL